MGVPIPTHLMEAQARLQKREAEAGPLWAQKRETQAGPQEREAQAGPQEREAQAGPQEREALGIGDSGDV